MWSCEQSLATMREDITQPQFYKDLTKKTPLLGGGLGSSSITWD